jgi:sialate O-acetylesterase
MRGEMTAGAGLPTEDNAANLNLSLNTRRPSVRPLDWLQAAAPLQSMKKRILTACALLATTITLHAELLLPAIFSDHMVLQQKQADPIWGWDTPGTTITVTFAGQTHFASAGADGKWTVKLDPLPANATPQTLTISGTSTRTIQDVLIGEVWLCSGQSNMRFTLDRDWNGDVEAAASRLPAIRLLRLPNVSSEELRSDIKGEWTTTTPETARKFSAIGFLFGRYIHEIVGVPVGLIDNAWGGSAAEAWIRRSALEGDPRFAPLMARAQEQDEYAASPEAKAAYAALLAQWDTAVVEAKAAGRAAPRKPADPAGPWRIGHHRPGNLFAGVLHPTLGYGLKGVIWYQGEQNASHAHEYRELFPFLIEQWRKEWGQGNFPFYWVQLADHKTEKPEPGDSDWAELREAQTMTLRLPRTGQAVIIDLGEGRDIHPRNKHDVAARLVRWALVNDYGMKLPYRSPEFKSVSYHGNKALVTFDCFGSRLRPFDVDEARGFAVCGADKVWHWAAGKDIGQNQVEVSSDAVPAPVAVRYAWADNPVCNLFSNDGLPVTPFRTDDFAPATDP